MDTVNNSEYRTMFDIAAFLKDVSFYMLPKEYRTQDNLERIALLADIYGISMDKMRNYIAKTVNTGRFDLEFLKGFCSRAKIDFTENDETDYNVPCVLYLMSLQKGKDVTPYDKAMLYSLSTDYHLSPQVINALLRFSLKRCDNRLIKNYVYAAASDLYRNDVKTAEEVEKWFDFIQKKNKKQNHRQVVDLPVYDTSKNAAMSKKEEEEILALMGKLK